MHYITYSCYVSLKAGKINKYFVRKANIMILYTIISYINCHAGNLYYFQKFF